MQESVDRKGNEAPVSDDESVLDSVSPQEAAAQRARIRKKNLEASLGIEADFAPDITFAEEAYDDPSELLNEAGMLIEPFHLKREREDGYFDGDGNYVVFKFDEVRDTWVDSLEEGPLRERVKCGNIGDTTMDDESDLEDIDIVDYKKKIVELLESGETVLDGLRRLAHRRDSDLETKELGKKAAKLLERQRQVPAENQIVFEQLTEYSSLLMAYGECNIYNLTKEKMLEDIQNEMAESQQAENGTHLNQASERDRKNLSPTKMPDDINMFGKESPRGVTTEPNALPISNGLEQATDNKMDASCNEDSDIGTTTAQEAQPDTAAGQEDQNPNLEGYVFDSDSGKYYNSEKGYYYDPSTELYRNASTGVMYKLVNGVFEAV